MAYLGARLARVEPGAVDIEVDDAAHLMRVLGALRAADAVARAVRA